MRTTSADQFIDFVQNLEIDTRMNRGIMGNLSNAAIHQMHHGLRVTTPDRTSDSDNDQFGSRTPTSVSSSRITVAEGDFLQPERIQNGIVFNVVRKEVLTPSGRSHGSPSEHSSPSHDSVAECMQLDCPEKEMDAASVSESGDDNRDDIGVDEGSSGRVAENPSGDEVCDKHVTGGG